MSYISYMTYLKHMTYVSYMSYPRGHDLEEALRESLVLSNRKGKSWIFGVWAAPGGRETLKKGGRLRPPSFWKASRPPGAAQTPKFDDSRSVRKPCGVLKIQVCRVPDTASF